MRTLLWLAGGLAALFASAGPAVAQTSSLADVLGQGVLVAERPPLADTRFFGDYCLPAPKEFCKSVFLLPDPCVTLSKVRAHIDHLTFTNGSGVRGSGTLTLDGKEAVLVLAGRVRARGEVGLVTLVPGLGQQRSTATLSANGLRLTTSVQNRTLTLRKDACGNNPPQVTLASTPGNPVPLGQSVMLSATITDEDTAIPAGRIVFTSDRQGVLPGWRPVPRTLSTTVLAPGTHRITVSVTDGGGLTGSASGDIVITNRPPAAQIYLPTAGASLVAGGQTLLKGSAMDPDTGPLAGGLLSWSAQLSPGAAFVPLGTGTERPATFTAAADPVVIRLTATDGGNTVQVNRTVRVLPNTGNTPPVVVIAKPQRGVYSGQAADGVFAGTQTTFVATAWDAETAPADMQLRWEFTLLRDDGSPDPTPPQPNPAAITGTLAPTMAFPAVGARLYRVTFTATDAGGLSASDSVDILVTSQVIL